jgi:hypothetical protein
VSTDAATEFRHALLNGVNNVRLAIAVLRFEIEKAEQLEWLDQIERGADNCIRAIDDAPDDVWRED